MLDAYALLLSLLMTTGALLAWSWQYMLCIANFDDHLLVTEFFYEFRTRNIMLSEKNGAFALPRVQDPGEPGLHRG